LTLPFGPVTIMGKAIDTTGNVSVNAVSVITDLGDPLIGNVVATEDFDPTYPGTLVGCTVSGGNVVADALDSFYGTDSQSFYGADADPFYEASAFSEMSYTTAEITPASVLVGSKMTLDLITEGETVLVQYKLVGATPEDWTTWPGQLMTTGDTYQFRVTIGAGPVQGKITFMQLIIDAPDIVETVSDLTIAATPTAIPYTSAFTVISVVNATLQANASAAVTVEVDKTTNLAPTIKAYNVAHTAVAGAKADIILQGY